MVRCSNVSLTAEQARGDFKFGCYCRIIIAETSRKSDCEQSAGCAQIPPKIINSEGACCSFTSVRPVRAAAGARKPRTFPSKPNR
jgi:hypothetical protein